MITDDRDLTYDMMNTMGEELDKKANQSIMHSMINPPHGDDYEEFTRIENIKKYKRNLKESLKELYNIDIKDFNKMLDKHYPEYLI